MNAIARTNWDALFEEARGIPILDVAEHLGAKLKRSGAEWIGPCPCGSATTDGFGVRPAARDGGVFICRRSGSGGDGVAMAEHVLGCDKRAALEFVLGRQIDLGRQETAWEKSEREEAAREREASLQARRAREAAEEAAKRQRGEEAIADILRRAVPIAGTHAEAYLRETRGLAPAANLLSDILFVKELAFWGCPNEDVKMMKWLAELPAMVAVIRDVAGKIIGLHRTFLNVQEPTKYRPPCERENAKKVLGEQKGGFIRLGPVGPRLAIGEGLEKTLGFYQLLPDGCDDLTIACGINLNNMMGGRAGTAQHPTRVDPKTGKLTPIPNGFPDMTKPGMILPPIVRELILLQDSTSEPVATRAAIATAARRHMNDGLVVSIAQAPLGVDFDEICLRRAKLEVSI